MSYKCKKTRGIHHVCLRVMDPRKTAEFYQSVLDAKLIAQWGDEDKDDYGILIDLGKGDMLEIFKNPPNCIEGRWQHVAVYTKNIEATYTSALDHGALPHESPRYHEINTLAGDIIKMSYAFVLAPGGELLEFIQDRMDGG